MKTICRMMGMVMVTLLLVIIPNEPPHVNETGLGKLSNPAYDYCAGIMGYEFQVVTGPDGAQAGLCKLPDGSACSDWDFYAGKCGSSYSWCEQHGYNLDTRKDGKDPYSPEYAVCVDHQRSEVGKVSSLSGLDELASNGIVFSRPGQEGDVSELPVINPGTLAPASFDWRNFTEQDWITSVKNQSTCGSCWAFSTVALTEAQQNIITKNPNLDLDLSEQYLVSDCYVSGDCDFGGSDTDAMEFIYEYGIPDEACYPYRSADSSCSERCSDWETRLHFLPNVNHSVIYSNNDIKYILSNYGPLTINFWMGSGNSNEPSGSFVSGIYRCTNEIATNGDRYVNHSVLAVGYNDNNGNGYWIAKNSWGTGFGEGGFFKLGYNECNVDDSVIGWTESSLPITIDEFNYLPAIMKPIVPPGAFAKTAPANGALVPSTYLILDWSDSAGATSYDLCYDLNFNGECTGGWAPIGSNSQFNLSALLIPGFTFEWQVRAKNSTGIITVADDGAVWRFTVDNP